MSVAPDTALWAEVAGQFGLTGAVSPLPGERTLNARLDGPDGAPVAVLKLHRMQDAADAELEAHVLSRLASSDAVRGRIPAPIPVSGQDATMLTVSAPDAPRIARALTWVGGGSPEPHDLTVAAAWHLGALVARVDAALAEVKHPAGDRPLLWNPLQHKKVHHLIDAVGEMDHRDQCRRALDGLAAVEGELSALPRQLIHADANRANIMLGPDRMPTALVDFGDVCNAPRVAGLAVAVAYLEAATAVATPGCAPWSRGAALVAGYHRVSPLTETELALIPALALGRLATSVVMAAVGHADDPTNAYLLSSQREMLAALARLTDADRHLALARLRHAAGYEPCPHADAVRTYLSQSDPKPLLGFPLTVENATVVDWTGHQDTTGDVTSEQALLGRYLEDREVYTATEFLTAEGPRTVHLAVDVFVPAGTTVHAPLDGVIEIAADNDRPLDYGPVIVLRHEVPDVPPFFTLYGHLSRENLVAATPGRRVKAGEAIGTVGTRTENGGWSPHVHLQVLTDLVSRGRDVQGVAARADLGVWRSLSPNPNVMLRYAPMLGRGQAPGLSLTTPWPMELVEAIEAVIAASTEPWPIIDQLIADRQRRSPLSPGTVDGLAGLIGTLPPDGPLDPLTRLRRSAGTAAPGLRTSPDQGDSAALLERRRAAMGGAISPLFYRDPIEIVRGEGVWLFDRQGRRYLDGYNNVAVVGHSHPAVVRAVSEQAARLHTHSRYLHPNVVELAERLLALMPADCEFDTVLFTTSGTEANELAWRLATASTGHDGAVIGANAYHGASRAMADLSSNEWPPAYHPAWVATFDGPVQSAELLTKAAASGRVAAAAAELATRGRAPAMVIADTMFTSEGVRTVPAFLAGLVSGAHQSGALYVADEVQIGFGRTGPQWWWFAAMGIRPDVVTLGKPMAAGYPVGAVVTRRSIAESLGSQYEYFSTFAANPVGSAAALAVLDVMQDGQIPARAAAVGEVLRHRVRELTGRFPEVGEVRGVGLIAGVDLPDRDRARAVVEGLKQQGVLVGSTGREGNVLKVRPPLVWTEEHVEVFIAALTAALSHTSNG